MLRVCLGLFMLLQIRKQIQEDPFGLGFDHKNSDRTTVRLSFQVQEDLVNATTLIHLYIYIL